MAPQQGSRSQGQKGQKGQEGQRAPQTGAQGSAANVTHALKGIDFPANKPDIIAHAQRNNADPSVLNELRNLPEKQYENMADVMKGFGQTH